MGIQKILAILLLTAGTLALVYGGFTYTTETHRADMGPIQMSFDEREHINVPIWAGVGAIVVGGVLLVMGSRKGS